MALALDEACIKVNGLEYWFFYGCW